MLNVDTHILIHALSGSLKKKERDLLSTNEWSISSIVIWEISKLSFLQKIEFDFGRLIFSGYIKTN